MKTDVIGRHQNITSFFFFFFLSCCSLIQPCPAFSPTCFPPPCSALFLPCPVPPCPVLFRLVLPHALPPPPKLASIISYPIYPVRVLTKRRSYINPFHAFMHSSRLSDIGYLLVQLIQSSNSLIHPLIPDPLSPSSSPLSQPSPKNNIPITPPP